MAMRQGLAEYAKNIQELEKSILPAVLKQASQSNNQLFIGWLLKNCCDQTGVVDASVDNMRRAVSALHKAGLIEWEETKAPKILSETMSGPKLRDHAQPEEPRNRTIFHELDDKLKKEEANVALLPIIRSVENYFCHPHSEMYRRRDKLRKSLREMVRQFDAGKITVPEIQTKIKAEMAGFGETIHYGE